MHCMHPHYVRVVMQSKGQIKEKAKKNGQGVWTGTDQLGILSKHHIRNGSAQQHCTLRRSHSLVHGMGADLHRRPENITTQPWLLKRFLESELRPEVVCTVQLEFPEIP